MSKSGTSNTEWTARLLAVDPGDVHVGAAVWQDRRYQYAVEIDQATLWEIVSSWAPTVVVVESFHLYPWRARTQSFSKMKTAELIGAIRRTAELNGIAFVEQGAGIQATCERSPYYRRHVEEHGRPSSPHARSALLHGLHFLNFGKGSR